MKADAVAQVLACYPKIYFACHVRHTRDPKTRQVLSAHQASILDHLDEREPTSLGDLAKHMGVSASTMSLNIGRLMGGGFVRKSRNQKDGRGVALRLTEAGVRIKSASRVLDESRVAGMLAKLSASDRAAALQGLALLARASQDFMSERKSGWRKQNGGDL